ncbi:helix-turn-helix domain-containing protein [Aestuariicella hydrocarbonica]|uniref:Helix-turn-helix domain-containing protein n=1 Tax=Pseudomaricurvus hydrocarbonicus TaxID=1470433 RepID=A0A9E5JR26_9GAMM|nr:helix-turn-helix domain-containing protein [Aestuariicella hydrocarbonica]NHO65172.1 helix-turn-helix domain-containing protein [Aestuariicella hydrocarbonica]
MTEDSTQLLLSQPEGPRPSVFCEDCSVRKTCVLSQACINAEIARVMRRPKPIHKGHRLFIQGDKFDTFYLVKSGSFKSTMIDNEGNSQVVSFQFPQDILGYDGMQSGKHVYEVEALETSSICALSFPALKRISSESSSGLLHQLMAEVSGMIIKESKVVMVLARMHSEQRLASFLLETSDRMVECGLSGREFKLSMQRYDIANYLGLAVETVSRLFRHMEEEGIIHAQRHWVQILDMEKLKRIKAAEYKFSGVSKAV